MKKKTFSHTSITTKPSVILWETLRRSYISAPLLGVAASAASRYIISEIKALLDLSTEIHQRRGGERERVGELLLARDLDSAPNK